MRRLAIVVALVLAGCGDDDATTDRSAAPVDVDRCLAAATAVGGLEPPADLRGLADNAAVVAATARTTGVDDDLLAAALAQLDEAATALLEAAGADDREAVTDASRRVAAAYAAIDDAAQGMETAECGRRSWGARATTVPA